MSINVSNAQSTTASATHLAETKKQNTNEIKLFNNQKVMTDINAISSRYGTADFDDNRERAELKDYIDKFKDYLSAPIQRFLSNIANGKASYTAQQIEEMASHTDKSTRSRTEDFAKAFAQMDEGTVRLIDALFS